MSKYDIEIREEEPGDGLYGWTAPQQYTKTRGKKVFNFIFPINLIT